MITEDLFEMIGAVYGWCWIRLYEYKVRYVEGWVIYECVAIRDYSYTFKYWPAGPKRIVRPVLERRPLVTRAGFMSESRGLHWDRK